jgi:hypothetical protein
MPWGFMVGSDNGDGDKALGMDKEWHADDWDNLHSAYRSRAAALEAQSRPVTLPTSDLASADQVFTQAPANLRREPGLQGAFVVLLPANLRVHIQGAARRVDSLAWWPVQATLGDGSTISGWVAQTTPNGQVLLTAR